jgi:hypothetical protein
MLARALQVEVDAYIAAFAAGRREADPAVASPAADGDDRRGGQLPQPLPIRRDLGVGQQTAAVSAG